jgi:hypothetical protein
MVRGYSDHHVIARVKQRLRSWSSFTLTLYPQRSSRRILDILLKRLKSSEELDDPVSALRRGIVEAKQRWSAIGWVTKNLLSRAPPCFGRLVKLLVPAAFAVVSTHQTALGPCGGLWPVLLMCNP